MTRQWRLDPYSHWPKINLMLDAQKGRKRLAACAERI